MNERHIALAVPLAGRHLVEAGAGTGKTFAIKTIYLRLVLEAALPVSAILTVTYTEAAAAELADRIRRTLEAALAALTDGVCDDPVLAEALELAAAENPAALLKKRLSLALRDFDEVAISTIHGFCFRMLKEFAFENRRLFSMELSGDLAPLIDEIVRDYLLLRFAGRDRRRAALLEFNRLTPAALADFIRLVLGKPGAVLEPETAPEPDFAAIDLELAAVSALWRREREAILRLLADSSSLSRARTAYSPENIGFHAAELDLLAEGDFRPSGFRALEFFSAAALAEAVTPARKKKGETAPEHAFFRRCDTAAAHCRLGIAFRLDALRFAERELARRREEQGLSSYGDLLLDFAAALADPATRQAVRRRFSAALIDEFQDTDPIQYRIFDALFPAAGPAPLFLVGDPKQAIYAFRGADLHTYAAAKRETEQHWRLDCNFRSERRLVAAVNELFLRPGVSPFASELVEFARPLASAGRPEAEERAFLLGGEVDPAPLKLLYPSPGLAEQLGRSVTAGTRFATELTAAAIARMLNDPRQTIGLRRLRPSDFAVLVANNLQAPEIKRALGRLGIPAILRKSDDVFASAEAEKLQYLLNGLLHADELPKVRQALSLDIFGLTADELRDEERLFELQDRLRRYAEAWRQSGFITAFYLLWAEFGVRRRLLELIDGERRLTNYQHLAELLHVEERRRKLTARGLFDFFRDGAGRGSEEAELRLESDRDAVTVVTVHKSKGLQYGIVFCPYLFSFGAFRPGDTVCCHPAGRPQPVIRLEPDEAAVNQAAAESFSERLRLLYVALTRAENRCVVIHYPTRDANALDYLFGDAPELAAKAGSAIERIAVDEVPAGEYALPSLSAPPLLVLPDAVRRIESRGHLSSFTSLTRHEAAAPDEFTDYDAGDDAPDADEPEVAELPAAAEERGGIFDFPGGERTGNCFHKIFEELDFAAARPETIRAAAAANLARFGFDADPGTVETVAGMVENTIRAELAPGLRLEGLRPADTLREMRFLFPVNPAGVPARAIRALLERYSRPDKPYALPEYYRGGLPPASMLTGAIDLIFRHEGRYYLADWKSNRIGGRRASFAAPGLFLEMAAHSYCLQYLLYIVALDRHLALRQPGYSYEEHFGGVFYCFVRGIDAADPAGGIYRDLRPEPEFIRELAELLPEAKA